jgi:hypothetical protein
MDAPLADDALELEAVAAIYGDDCAVDGAARRVVFFVPSAAHPARLTLTATLPPSYPTAPPSLTLAAPHLAPADAAGVCEGLVEAHWGDGGEPCLYEVVEALRRRDELFVAEPDAADAVDDEAHAPAIEAARPPSPPLPPPRDAAAALAALSIVSSPPIRHSCTFQAHTAPVASVAGVRAVVDALLAVPKIARATHNIMAFRLTDPETGVSHADCDDDGEAAAGGRLLFMMRAAHADNAVVVVSRWFGGRKLGPARFGLIQNCGRAALAAGGFLPEAGGGGGRGGKGKQH